jgi:polyhydroxyalkanoate synthesis regulator phasin
MSKKFCHSAPKAFAPDDDLDKYIKNWLSRSQQGLVKRIEDLENNVKFSKDDVRTLNNEVRTLKGELENSGDDSVIPLGGAVKTLKDDVEDLLPLEAEVENLKRQVKELEVYWDSDWGES